MVTRNAATMGSYGAAWEYRGYCGSGNVQPILGSIEGRVAVVCGNSREVFEDYARIVNEETIVFAVNDVGVYLPRVDHMVSHHIPKLANWVSLRIDGEGRWIEGTRVHTGSFTDKIHSSFLYYWQGLCPQFALSGYFAAQIAYCMGAERIILCGCPAMPWPRFFELETRPDLFGYGNGTKGNNDRTVTQQLTEEMARRPDFKSRVRSMSGWTKDFFGGV